jgi:hypothetical protein
VSDMYEVLNLWAEVDPLPLRSIAARLADMRDKKIGLFTNDKLGADPIQTLVEAKMKEKYPGLKFSRFLRVPNISVAETHDKARFVDWIKGLDAVIFAVGD